MSASSSCTRTFCQSTVLAEPYRGVNVRPRHVSSAHLVGGSNLPSANHAVVSPLHLAHVNAMRSTSGRTPDTRTTFPRMEAKCPTALDLSSRRGMSGSTF